MNRLSPIIYGLAIVGIALLFARDSVVPSIYLYQQHAEGRGALAITGWLTATLGPIALSIGIWLAILRLKTRWLAHLLFVPVVITIFRGGGSLFLYGVGASGSNSPEGFSLLMASALLFLAIVVHAVGFCAELYKSVGYKGVKN